MGESRMSENDGANNVVADGDGDGRDLPPPAVDNGLQWALRYLFGHTSATTRLASTLRALAVQTIPDQHVERFILTAGGQFVLDTNCIKNDPKAQQCLEVSLVQPGALAFTAYGYICGRFENLVSTALKNGRASYSIRRYPKELPTEMIKIMDEIRAALWPVTFRIHEFDSGSTGSFLQVKFLGASAYVLCWRP